MNSIIRPTCLSLIALGLATSPAIAAEDGPPPDLANILQTLDTLEKQHQQAENSLRQRVLAEAQSAASDPQRAAALWEQAEKVSKDVEQFRAWKDREGSALDSKEVRNALRIHFNWLLLTMQKSNGAKVRDLLPAIINHTKEVAADQFAMENFEEQLKRQKELADKSGRQGPREREKRSDEFVKAMHNRVAGQSVKSSPVAQMLRYSELMDDLGAAAPQGKKQEVPTEPKEKPKWELSPFNFDGIYQAIILPELREMKDQRILEYWDNRLRQEADRATKSKSALEIDKFNQIKRPQIQWDRALEMEGIGLRNRAINEMFSIVRANPAHPNVETWMQDLKNKIKPPAPATASTITPAP